MRARFVIGPLLAPLVGCGDPAVQMTLQVPSNATTFDASCVASVQVAALGPNYAHDSTDYKQACVDLPMAQPTLADVESALRGLVTVAIPDSGLSRILVYGNGTSCAALPTNQGIISADLIFYASAPYDGGDIVMPMVPNVACAQSAVSVQPIQMAILATAHTCSTAQVPSTTNAGVNLGTLTPNPAVPGVFWSGGLEASDLAGGIATIANARVSVAPGNCLAFFAGDDSLDAVTCAQPSLQPVCAPQNTLEVGVIPLNTVASTIDQTLQAQFGPPTFGLVYGGSGDTGAPISGATVTLDDPKAGTVLYFDVPPGAVNGTGGLTKLPGQATSAAGMFAVYATGFHQLTVSANGATQKLTVGAIAGDPGTAIVRMH